MKFGPVPVDDAEGAILAHSLKLAKGRLRKGRVLSRDDVQQLSAAGISDVTVALLEEGDIGEDPAAERLARALVPDAARAGLRLGVASTGRVNIYADRTGVVEVLADRIDALNALHPMITTATVPKWQRVAVGDMVATVKIISYAVPQAALEAACLAGQTGLRVRGVTCQRASLIQTRVDEKDSGEKGHSVTAARLSRMGVSLEPLQMVPHEIDPLATALQATDADILLILTGSATSDAFDTAPEALRRAGGTVTHFGMPVDPGNLLFFGELGGRPVIGLPGCAKSPAMNGADWVLERLLCGVPVSSGDIAGMGVGGLLKEIPQRGRLRDG
ncbi:putative molybdopterin binding domain protein [Pelagimonas phthalicica]|uniref:Putative molybdopterin binding domain protein n=1 Tax=Pelagimonas phthalicica TaxID=1037362 RepID=A0A238JEC6_9RHOB|nr:molybdopterin-binding protein [Pelagimonas phthalicica]TDS91458.1 molybdenum cofactor cytidylyltransferase [Pelagimonas phthalicica]SMX28507.1 putative molybdopterin binding domain protein [Pelagimonas phthalicica]